MCKPFNDKTMSTFIDMAIIFENNKFIVTGLTDDFKAVNLGSFDFLLDAYSRCCSFGFDIREYEVAISPFENKVVQFTLD